MQKRNIILVGFMGTGKTAVGIILARRLGWRFVDLDQEIVKETGLTVTDIFRELGEAFFRRLEKRVLARHCLGQEQVLAAGGGAVCDPENLETMKKSGTLVCLTAPVETITERLREDDSRPLLDGHRKEEKIEDLLKRRMRCYRKADILVDTAGLSPEKVAGVIESRVAGH